MTMHDQTEYYGHSLIQHGPANDRIYLMKLEQEDYPDILERLDSLAEQHNYSKIFAKIPGFAAEAFEKKGYRCEASIPGLYRRSEDGFFMCRYRHPDRLIDHDADRVQQVLDVALARSAHKPDHPLPDDAESRLATPADCPAMADLYAQVFASYPFPIDDPAYLAKTMEENLIYAGIWQREDLLALASAEMDEQGANAEMTDFATDPNWRGHGLANILLRRLEREVDRRGISTSYTIARATSFGMNICFARNGYQFGGTLIKNTQISGKLESMNVWYKELISTTKHTDG